MARQLAGRPEVSLEIDLERLVPGGVLHLEQRAEVRIGAGVVHQHVGLSESADGFPDQRGAIRFLAGMRGERVGGGSELLGELLQRLHLARGQNHPGASIDESASDGRADPAGGPGDDGDPIL